MNPVTPEQAVSLVEAVTPLLTGPTAGLVTVLVVVLVFSGLFVKYILPAYLEHVKSQREQAVAQVQAMNRVSAAIEAIEASIESMTSVFKAELAAMRGDLDEQSKDINALRRDVTKLSKTGDKS
jgi:cell division protein FtsB